MITFTAIENDVGKRLDSMIQGAQQLDAVINRYLVPEYQNAQAERWKTENQSEGQKWGELSPRYLAWKQKVKSVGGMPVLRGGRSILILTGRLAQAALLKNEFGQKLISHGQLKVTITLPYAGTVNKDRNFMDFSQKTKDRMKQVIREALSGRAKTS